MRAIDIYEQLHTHRACSCSYILLYSMPVPTGRRGRDACRGISSQLASAAAGRGAALLITMSER
jgi:hypothetical protein